MKTRLDPAIRLGRRALDTRRQEIAEAVAQVAALEAEAVKLAGQARREAEALAADPGLGGEGHLAMLRARRVGLLRQLADADERLDALRALAGEEMARLRALEDAAERHREAARADALRREAAEADDRAAARFLAARAVPR